jgi:hypothetical protein
MPREAGQWECPLASLGCVQPPRGRLGFVESVLSLGRVSALDQPVQSGRTI